MFLVKQELETVATIEIINLITNNKETIITDIIDESIDLFSTYLYQYYDTEKIFSQVGDNRSKTILKHLKAVVIFEVAKRRKSPISKYDEEAKDEAMLWLEKVSKGEIKPPLPIRLQDTDGDGEPDNPATFLKLGSNKKYQNHF